MACGAGNRDFLFIGDAACGIATAHYRRDTQLTRGDGASTAQYGEAELILIGVSRSGKSLTRLSVEEIATRLLEAMASGRARSGP